MPAIEKRMAQKRVTITSKRQFTIPQRFYTELGFEKDALCTMRNGVLIIEPVSRDAGGEFAEQILAELIAEGYEGAALLNEFRTRQKMVRPAVEKMLDAAKEVAAGKGEYATYADIFGTED